MVITTDASFLFSLDGDDSNTPAAISWVQSQRIALTLTALNEFELSSALRFAEFRQAIGPGDAALSWSHFEADRASGRLKTAICNLADILIEANRFLAAHTLTGGHRGFDILDVAASIRLKAGQFLTFDENQRKLAMADGLVVPL
jgi:hypothetical protein